MKQFRKDIPEDPYVWGHNVTQRYIDLYQASLENTKLDENETIANFVVFKNEETRGSESRVSCRIDIIHDGENKDFGYSPRKTDDMNNFLKMKLKKETSYIVKVSNPEHNMEREYKIDTGIEDTQEFILFLNK
jgi:hypothetical protein